MLPKCLKTWPTSSAIPYKHTKIKIALIFSSPQLEWLTLRKQKPTNAWGDAGQEDPYSCLARAYTGTATPMETSKTNRTAT